MTTDTGEALSRDQVIAGHIANAMEVHGAIGYEDLDWIVERFPPWTPPRDTVLRAFQRFKSELAR